MKQTAYWITATFFLLTFFGAGGGTVEKEKLTVWV